MQIAAWNVHLLQRMADIDMQRLDWKQALRVYEQIRTLRPDDQAARKQLLELYARHRSGSAGHLRVGKLPHIPSTAIVALPTPSPSSRIW